MAEDLLRAAPEERAALERLSRQLDDIARSGGSARLVGPRDETFAVPPSALRALKLLVDGFDQDHAFALATYPPELSLSQAADLLGLSSARVSELLEAGTIPHRTEGVERLIRRDDVLAFAAAERARRREGLDEIVRISEEIEGGYQ